jgi:hypothetical protein
MRRLKERLIFAGILLILFFTIFDLYYPSSIGDVGQLLGYLALFISAIIGMILSVKEIKKK